MGAEIKPIVGFSTQNCFLSEIVRWGTRSSASHCWFEFLISETPLIVHANERGVNVISKKLFLKNNQEIARFEVDIDISPAIDELLVYLGAGYDYTGLVGQGWVTLGQLLGRNWVNPLQDKDRWYCSELVAHLLQDIGEDIPYDPSAVSPGLLLQLMSKSKAATKLG